MMRNWRPALRVPVLGVGLGALAGGLEIMALGIRTQLSWTADDAVLLATIGVALGVLLSALLGVPVGLVLDRATRESPLPRRLAMGMAIVATALGCWYLWPLGHEKWQQGLAPAAGAFCVAPIGLAGVVWFNAHYWLRREAVGVSPRVGWTVIGVGGGLLCSAVGALWMTAREYGSSRALPDDPIVVVITVDGLRGALPERVAPATPFVDELSNSGVRFDNVVSPVPLPFAAQTALFTGRHPVRAGAYDTEPRLARGYQTLAEVFSDEGFATGAFLSSRDLAAGQGLEQGFDVWDAEPAGSVYGLRSIRVIRLLESALGEPLFGGVEVHRGATETVSRAVAWLRALEGRPALLWIELAEPWWAESDADYARSLTQIDGHLRDIVEAAERASGERDVVVGLVGVRGNGLGTHETPRGTPSLWDDVVRVSFILRLPDMKDVVHQRVQFQTRQMDVPATLLAAVKLDPMTHSEGADLMEFARGSRNRHFASLLALPESSASRPELAGYRAVRSDEEGAIKFLWEPDSDVVQLFDLVIDANERDDVSASQTGAVQELRARVDKEMSGAWAR